MPYIIINESIFVRTSAQNVQELSVACCIFAHTRIYNDSDDNTTLVSTDYQLSEMVVAHQVHANIQRLSCTIHVPLDPPAIMLKSSKTKTEKEWG